MALQKNLGNAAVSGDVESTDNKLGGSNFYQVMEISVDYKEPQDGGHW